MGSESLRRRAFWHSLALVALGVSVISVPALWSQDQPPSQKSAAPSKAEQADKEATRNTTQKPAEPPPAEAPKEPEKLQLETPKVEAPPTVKPQAPQEVKPSAPAAAQPEGPPVIEEIIFRGNRRIPGTTLRARIFSHKGDLYDENALERDFMALWNTGFLDDIRLEVTEGEKGKIITFFVREKKLVRSIDNKGLSTVSWSDVLDEFKKRKVGLSIQSQYDPVVIKRAEVVLQGLLAEHGRQFATVRARTRNIPPNSVALTFIVVEGPKVKVGRVRFQGNKVFANRTLVRTMKLTRPWGAPPWFYWFHKTYDKDKVLYDLEKVRELYQDHGYFYALPKEPIVKMTDTRRRWPFFFYSWGRGKRVDLTIPLEEGDRYRLGRFVIRGNKLFKQEALQLLLQMKPGDVFNRGKVTKAIENYTKLYGQFGYINFTASPNIEPNNKKHVIDLALDFEEDKQYFVHRIELSGNTKTRDKVVRRELLVNEGDVFNTGWWDLSVLRVNQLGFFDVVKKEDYDIKQNAKEGTVDINLKLKEKGRNSIGLSGGVSGLAGNFIGVNYATNNFLGLGETLSVQMEVGTFQRLYSFGFTEPYIFDRPITTGFTVYKSDYHFDQLRQAAFLGGFNPAVLQQSGLANFTQNFQQNSTGFTTFASFPMRRNPFARAGLTYSFSVSNVVAFSPASQAFFGALAFRQYQGPNQLSGIVTSQIMPTYQYNTVNNEFNPTGGKYFYSALSFSGSVLGGNVNTIRPVIEGKYFRPLNRRSEKPHVLGFHALASTISGYGGRVPPPFARIYMGGEYDIRGFDIYTISPLGFFPQMTSVCNRDNLGNIIPLLGSNGRVILGPNGRPTCGSSTRFPYNALQFPGGDSELLTNFEYRVPIAGPVTVAYFVDTGTTFIWRPSQLKIQPTALSDIRSGFPYFPLPDRLKPIGLTNFRPRSSTGIAVNVILPIVNAPIQVFWGYNWLRMVNRVTPPQDLPPLMLFPNQATYNDALSFFQPIHLRERKTRLGFTVARTF